MKKAAKLIRLAARPLFFSFFYEHWFNKAIVSTPIYAFQSDY